MVISLAYIGNLEKHNMSILILFLHFRERATILCIKYLKKNTMYANKKETTVLSMNTNRKMSENDKH